MGGPSWFWAYIVWVMGSGCLKSVLSSTKRRNSQPLSSAPQPVEKKGNHMQSIQQLLRKLLTEDSAQDLVEYAIVGALLAVGATGALEAFETYVSITLNSVGSGLTAAVQ